MNNLKYPKEVYSALSADKVLSITAHLIPSEVEKGTSPYKIYQAGKSRFVFSVVNTKDKTYPTGNIRVDEIAGILANTKSAHQIDMFSKIPVFHQMFAAIKELHKMVSGVQEAIRMVWYFLKTGQIPQATKSVEVKPTLANSVVIANGKLKGKTPFQVISEDARSIVDLNKQVEWLEKNLARFPDNQKQIDAIKEALQLHESGKLVAGDVSAGARVTFGTIPIYEPSPRALVREKDQNGLCPVYEIGIYWHVGDRYPVEIRVKRYKAPVVKQESGVINPQRSEAVEVQDNFFKLTSAQWADCTRLIEANMNRFEFVVAARQFREAEEADQANRAAYQ